MLNDVAHASWTPCSGVSTLPPPQGPGRYLLRTLLRSAAPRLGLTDRAVDALVTRSQMEHRRAGRRVFSPRDGGDAMHVLVAGAAQVVCESAGQKPLMVRIVPPGWLLNPAPIGNGELRSFGAVAHVPSLVAVIDWCALEELVLDLPSDRMLRLVALGWRLLSELVYEKCQLLRMPLRERVERELAILARDFGRRGPEGVWIDLPVTHDALAGLVAATRSNVCRVMGALRQEGRIAYVGGKIVLLDPLPQS